ncbi:MAG: dihydrofolate reductase family protein [Acetatifactor sp.]|nr:dihydrofolate reductase family protein [Acetatifactor sp.]MDE7353737.1 dihydrofolate reductase family protein [Acetatifactor sp.]
MRRVILFIAMSLDGYIADSEGKVGWLGGQGNDEEMIDTYSEFVANVDTVVMGWNTYDQIITELSPKEWVYSGLESYVVTHRDCPSTELVRFTGEEPCSLIRKLKKEAGKGIWICGGADIVRQLMTEDLIDMYYVSVIPMLLGKGIRLFGGSGKEIPLRLVKTQSYDGITDLVYERRE